MVKVLVTGGDGQLGHCLRAITERFENIQFLFTNKTELDITQKTNIDDFFTLNNFDWCINCAAYTAVDKAESEIESSKKINVTGVKNLAEACLKHDIKIIHISTDFVFDGTQNRAYKEDVLTNPLGVYGNTKLGGENELKKICSKHFIIRTSWLYSEFNQNFMKTMLRLAKDKEELNIVSDQIGSPTYARDLAEVIMLIINRDSSDYGLYHYSNEGVASWYDFAKAIFDLNSNTVKVIPVPTESYPTPSKRPHFSVLDKTKIKTTFNIEVPYWRDSLKYALSNLELVKI
ncbi:dTDP-4-dehydrorhamnose reductase [Psychroserpens mesophilus]|uniref:dTDP-4-dehydrorhamnose reductase n=1 Tax=Psychroserpens mesophilus TaxID=325473 RepID=UPI000590E613|nr:dTDP-4-dehydrorhamnose reductase [Psychroserpens mesophilus]